mmetsp:Transcript_30824/g.50989  ORF Transcript_30824/g.50989 Transcript_30824/m.50989 type:complete len:314 (+) Transcript_30824:155-1096(+)
MSKRTLYWTALTTLSVQNAVQMISMRYARLSRTPFLTSTAVVCAEVVKLVASLSMLYAGSGSVALHQAWHATFVCWFDTLTVSFPAFLYFIQNHLLYVATTHLDAATAQLIYQLKLLTTAVFTMIILRRHIPPRRWAALCILCIGVVLVQLKTPELATRRSQLIGTVAAVAAAVLSGLAGVWLEWIVKHGHVPVSLRNIQLSLVSLPLGLLTVLVMDGHAIATGGFFQNYTWATAFAILQVAAGGLLAGMIHKYADNVAKGFATSLSIVINSFLGWLLFDARPTINLIGGSALVLLATLLYSMSATPVAEKVS